MASVRGILNIQSLNELTRTRISALLPDWPSAGRLTAAAARQELDWNGMQSRTRLYTVLTFVCKFWHWTRAPV